MTFHVRQTNIDVNTPCLMCKYCCIKSFHTFDNFKLFPFLTVNMQKSSELQIKKYESDLCSSEYYLSSSKNKACKKTSGPYRI